MKNKLLIFALVGFIILLVTCMLIETVYFLSKNDNQTTNLQDLQNTDTKTNDDTTNHKNIDDESSMSNSRKHFVLNEVAGYKVELPKDAEYSIDKYGCMKVYLNDDITLMIGTDRKLKEPPYFSACYPSGLSLNCEEKFIIKKDVDLTVAGKNVTVTEAYCDCSDAESSNYCTYDMSLEPSELYTFDILETNTDKIGFGVIVENEGENTYLQFNTVKDTMYDILESLQTID